MLNMNQQMSVWPESDEHVQNPALRHYTIPLCQTLRSIKSRLTLHSCCVIRFTLDSRPKTSLQQVQKVQASSTTHLLISFTGPFSTHFVQLFNSKVESDHALGKGNWFPFYEEKLSPQTVLTDPFKCWVPVVSCNVFYSCLISFICKCAASLN